MSGEAAVFLGVIVVLFGIPKYFYRGMDNASRAKKLKVGQMNWQSFQNGAVGLAFIVFFLLFGGHISAPDTSGLVDGVRQVVPIPEPAQPVQPSQPDGIGRDHMNTSARASGDF